MLGADSPHGFGIEAEVFVGERGVRCVVNVGDILKGSRGDDCQLGGGLAVVILFQGMFDEP